MFRHDKCKNYVYVNISPALTFLVAPSIHKTELRVSSGEISIRENTIKTQFLCPQCNKEIENNEIIVQCMHCGIWKNIFDDVYVLEKSSGVYCDDCSSKIFSSEKKYSLCEIANTISIK